MSGFDEESANAFLANTAPAMDEDKAQDFLNGKSEIAEVASEPEPEIESGEKSIWESAGDWAAGANDSLTRTLGLPADAYNWVSEKLGSDSRVYGGSEDIGRGMAAIGAGYEVGKEPDTGSYKAGNYTGTGLLFLAPWLKFGKGAAEMTAAPVTVMRNGKQVTGMQAVQESAGTLKGMSQRMSAPFMTAPKLALTAEVTGSTAAGYGAEYGGENYGQVGEMIGGMGAGFAGSMAPHLALLPHAQRYVKQAFFPYTKEGGKIKAAKRLHTLAETINIEKTVAAEQKKILPKAKVSPAKLSGDRHMIALEKAVLKDDPQLAHQFKMDEAAVNAAARKEVEDLGGTVRIEETQAFLQGRVDRIKNTINRTVAKAVTKAQEAMGDMPAPARRKIVNETVNKQIDNALDSARGAEKEAWLKVDQKVMGTTDGAKTVLRQHLDDLPSTADEKVIPKYLRTFLGDKQKGKFVEGKLGSTESVKELSGLRSRINKDIRTEKALDVPDWNKIRIMNDVQEAILKDLEISPTAKSYMDAITISRELNDKFSGGVLNSILGHEKTGGKLASELTLEGIKNGPKAAVEIKRILGASPKSLDAIEEYVKIQIAQSNVVKEGRINLNPARKYMAENEEVMNIFPDLKRAMNNAISAQEHSSWLTDAGKRRMAAVSKSMTAKLAGAQPKRFLSMVMDSPNPDQTMKELSKNLNATGKAGIKHDITDYLLGKAKTAGFDENDAPIISGRKFANELKNNEKVFSKVMDESELNHLKIVADTMIKNEGMKDLPDIGGVLEPTRNPLSIALEIAATRIGAKAGAKTHGAALKTASMGSKIARDLLGELDTGRAKQLIKDAIQDPELFKALVTDHTTQPQIKRFMRIYHGWMAASAVENISENN